MVGVTEAYTRLMEGMGPQRSAGPPGATPAAAVESFPGAMPYRALGPWLKDVFGGPVHRLNLDAGLTCPNRDGTLGFGGCSFCGAEARVAPRLVGPDGIREQVAAEMRRINRRYGPSRFVAYFQAYTGTHGPVEGLHEMWSAALEEPRVVALAVGTRSDCLGAEPCAALASFVGRVRVWVELGLQTANDAALGRLARGEGTREFVAVCERAHGEGIGVVAHLILGLPGTTRADDLATVELCNACGVEGVKLHNLYIDSRSPLAAAHGRGEVRVMSLDEYCARVCDMLERLAPATVVHRLTAQTRQEFHIAPAWALDKAVALVAVRAEFARRASCQGSLFGVASG